LAAGGISDVEARVVAERMRGSLGQPVVVENISGADGSIGVGRFARARADGYTIGTGGNSTHVLNGALYSLQYDVLNDFAPISPLTASPFILNDAGEGPGRIDLLVEGQSQQGVGGSQRSGRSPRNCVLSERNRDAICSRTLSW
jgi:Tripartite tricarboxylate transporter family receptor